VPAKSVRDVVRLCTTIMLGNPLMPFSYTTQTIEVRFSRGYIISEAGVGACSKHGMFMQGKL
jgi:hypothetical protein